MRGGFGGRHVLAGGAVRICFVVLAQAGVAGAVCAVIHVGAEIVGFAGHQAVHRERIVAALEHHEAAAQGRATAIARARRVGDAVHRAGGQIRALPANDQRIGAGATGPTHDHLRGGHIAERGVVCRGRRLRRQYRQVISRQRSEARIAARIIGPVGHARPIPGSRIGARDRGVVLVVLLGCKISRIRIQRGRATLLGGRRKTPQPVGRSLGQGPVLPGAHKRQDMFAGGVDGVPRLRLEAGSHRGQVGARDRHHGPGLDHGAVRPGHGAFGRVPGPGGPVVVGKREQGFGRDIVERHKRKLVRRIALQGNDGDIPRGQRTGGGRGGGQGGLAAVQRRAIGVIVGRKARPVVLEHLHIIGAGRGQAGQGEVGGAAIVANLMAAALVRSRAKVGIDPGRRHSIRGRPAHLRPLFHHHDPVGSVAVDPHHRHAVGAQRGKGETAGVRHGFTGHGGPAAGQRRAVGVIVHHGPGPVILEDLDMVDRIRVQAGQAAAGAAAGVTDLVAAALVRGQAQISIDPGRRHAVRGRPTHRRPRVHHHDPAGPVAAGPVCGHLAGAHGAERQAGRVGRGFHDQRGLAASQRRAVGVVIHHGPGPVVLKHLDVVDRVRGQTAERETGGVAVVADFVAAALVRGGAEVRVDAGRRHAVRGRPTHGGPGLHHHDAVRPVAAGPTHGHLVRAYGREQKVRRMGRGLKNPRHLAGCAGHIGLVVLAQTGVAGPVRAVEFVNLEIIGVAGRQSIHGDRAAATFVYHVAAAQGCAAAEPRISSVCGSIGRCGGRG